MITVIGLDGSPLSRRAAEAVAGATLLVGGRRHLAAAGCLREEPARPAPPADPDSAVITAGRPAVRLSPHGTSPAGAVGGTGPTNPEAPHPTSTSPTGITPSHTDSARAAAARPRVVVLGPLRPALDALAAHEGDAVVLASGDPGFFGIVRALRERGLDYVVLPATSSVAQAFARAGLPWDDALVVSAHGRELRAAVNVCRAHPKVAVLTGPGQGPAEIGAALAGWPRRLLVAEDLGGRRERITECTAADAAERTWTDPNVLLVLADPHSAPPAPAPPVPAPSAATPAPSGGGGQSVINRSVLRQRHQSVDHEEDGPPDDPANPLSHTGPMGRAAEPSSPRDPSVIMTLVSPGRHLGHDHEAEDLLADPKGTVSHSGYAEPSWRWPPAARVGEQGWALGEEAFEHRDSMVTKPEVRALALARLGPRPGVLVWDVGAGSGSVAVECARFGAAVIAVERDPAQCARVAANARRHGAEVRIAGGAAPEALDGLPDPDAVFVGGGGLAVVSAVAARRPARIVVALAAMQRAGPALEALAGAGYTVDGTLLQASRLALLPDGAHRLAASNPVFLLWAARDTADHDAADRDGAGRDGAGRDHDHGQMGAL